MGIELSYEIYAVLIAFGVSIVLCPMFIPYLTRLKFGQTVRHDGPQTHLKKTGTPTMGGILIVFSIVVGSLPFMKGNPSGLLVLFTTVAFGLIGFLDDYIKVVKKRSMGLRAYQKFSAQLLVAFVFVYFLSSMNIDTSVYVPFGEGFFLDLKQWSIPFLMFVILGTVNGANFTDGLDGLAAGVTILVATFLFFVAYFTNQAMIPVLGAAIGALLGFLLFNSHPAKVFMGDTGSLALGGLVACCSVVLKMPILLVLVGFVYVAEVGSVILQVCYFKLTKGKRLFKMAPIHHHFEQMGWPETRVVALFYIITAILCLVGFIVV